MLEFLKKIKSYIWGPRDNTLSVDKYEVYMDPRSDIFITKIIEYRG